MERTQRKQDPEWGPYLSNRQWGTVREDTSHDGNAWECLSYEEACSTVYRWGEDGLFGYSDRDCLLCMCLALWNGEDHILKERLFGLTGPQGNHGEDIKELLYYLDGTPDHSYMKALYKYPYSFPYAELAEENKKRRRGDPEYEIMDTGLFDRNEYFDVQVEYAIKDHKGKNDLYCCYSITNQGDVERELWVIPQFWFRKFPKNQEKWRYKQASSVKNYLNKFSKIDCSFSSNQQDPNCIGSGTGYRIHINPADNVEILYTKNYEEEPVGSGNSGDVYGKKDGFHSYIIDGDQRACERFRNQKLPVTGDKCGILHKVTLQPKAVKKIYWAMYGNIYGRGDIGDILLSCEAAFKEGQQKARLYRLEAPLLKVYVGYTVGNIHYTVGADGIMYASNSISNIYLSEPQNTHIDETWKEEIIHQAYAGLFWNKQFYHYNVGLSNNQGNPESKDTVKALSNKVIDKDSEGDGNWQRTDRNKDWETLDSYDIISMPDKWEFPWFASWDLAFQMIPYARVDPEFAERQMLLLLSSRYMHPNGQIPGCEWGMESVFPPVHAWGCLQIHRIRLAAGKDNSVNFLVPCFEALRKNFDWWMNAMKFKDSNLFSGGFLGMDNISVVDRSYILSKGYPMQQADATGWMAMYALNMVEMAMCICKHKPVYGKYTVMYLNHFFSIAESLNTSINKGGLWDPHDKFYYDVCLTKTRRVPIRVRSLVGIVPLFAGMEIKDKDLNHCRRLGLFLKQRQYSRFIERRSDGYHISAVPKDRIGHLVRVLSDQEEFLSQYGVRSLSKVYKEDPYILHLDKELQEGLCVKGDKLELSFSPGESETGMFGGNSNWRGPVWLCMNYMTVLALNRWLCYSDLTNEIVSRIISLFKIDETTGLRPCHGSNIKYKEEGWRDLVLFHEFFDGDTGRGCGASHQTGWTALIIEFLLMD